jgi:hypothetical protein
MPPASKAKARVESSKARIEDHLVKRARHVAPGSPGALPLLGLAVETAGRACAARRVGHYSGRPVTHAGGRGTTTLAGNDPRRGGVPRAGDRPSRPSNGVNPDLGMRGSQPSEILAVPGQHLGSARLHGLAASTISWWPSSAATSSRQLLIESPGDFRRSSPSSYSEEVSAAPDEFVFFKGKGYAHGGESHERGCRRVEKATKRGCRDPFVAG